MVEQENLRATGRRLALSRSCASASQQGQLSPSQFGDQETNLSPLHCRCIATTQARAKSVLGSVSSGVRFGGALPFAMATSFHKLPRLKTGYKITRQFLFGLRVTWVSTVSVTCGFLLFYLSLQAQDVFLEARENITRTIAFWSTFYLVTAFTWVIPVYFSSLWILRRLRESLAAEDSNRSISSRVVRRLPRFLAISCFGSILVGQVLALVKTPTIETLHVNDQLYELLHQGTGLTISALYGILVVAVIWLLGWRAISSVSKKTPRRLLKSGWYTFGFLLIVPGTIASLIVDYLYHLEIFGLLLVSLVLIGIWLYVRHRRPPPASVTKSKLLIDIAWCSLASAVAGPILVTGAYLLGYIYVSEGRDRLGILFVALLPIVTTLVGALTWRVLHPGLNRGLEKRVIGLLQAGASSAAANCNEPKISPATPFFSLVAACSLIVVATIFLLDPVTLANFLARGAIIPILLGIYVPTFTYLSYWSFRTHTPLVFLSILFVALLNSSLRDPNDIRTNGFRETRSNFDDSVRRWASANDCDLDAKPLSERGCPSPIIIAAAGGASRAAFLTAGLIGEFLDRKTGQTNFFFDDMEAFPSFSPDESRVVALTGENVGRLFDLPSGREIAALAGHKDLVKSAVFSPSGNLILTTSEDGTARIWDGHTGKPKSALPVGKRIRSAQLNQTEDRVFTYSYSPDLVDSARIWDANSGSEIALLQRPNESPEAIAYSARGDRIATAAKISSTSDFVVRLWDGNTGALIREIERVTAYSATPKFSPSGSRLVTLNCGLRDEPLSSAIWNSETGDKVALLAGDGQCVQDVDFNHHEDRLINTKSRRPYLTLWDARSGEIVATLNQQGRIVFAPRFEDDGDRIITHSVRENVDLPRGDDFQLWDSISGSFIGSLGQVDGSPLVNVELNNKKKTIVATSEDGTFRELNARTGAQIGTALPTQMSGKRFLTIQANATDERILVSWVDEAGSTVAEVRDPKSNSIIKLEHLGADFKDFKWSPSGSWLYSLDGDRPGLYTRLKWSGNNVLRLWDSRSGLEIPIQRSPKLLTRKLRPFHKQLFALSGVSGGAFGVAVSDAAMADSEMRGKGKTDKSPPCRAGIKANDSDWFASHLERTSETSNRRDPETNWRSCLEMLVSGDFLSPVFLSMIGDPFEVALRGDRAAIMETAWERRYAHLTNAGSSKGTLADGLMEVRNRVMSEASDSWLPILILNGTSVATGRRVIVSDIALRQQTGSFVERLFPDSYELAELFKDTAGIRDVRISTAITTSARFPIISPHGNARATDGRITDRVVDGGYFDYFGANSALELSRKLRTYNLNPINILINNDPNGPEMDCVHGVRSSTTQPPSDVTQATPFGLLTSPIEALLSTSSSRGTYAAVQLCMASDQDRFILFTVGDEGLTLHNSLSMSWWLSKRVQKYLDDQIEAPSVFGTHALEDVTAGR
jgi:WD40 repeat protein